MNLRHYYYYFKSALSPRICDDILQYGKSQNSEIAVTGGVSSDDKNNYKVDGTLKKSALKNLQKKRKSDIVWMNDSWIYKEIHPYIHQANKLAGWNFQWDWSESCQFTKYEPGQFYDWHCDSWEVPYDKPNDPNSNGKIRKLSVTISLSDPSEYEGGNLEFDFRNNADWAENRKAKVKECTEIRPRGSIIVFPSFCWHRVNPVTKGTRYSLVIWNLGWPFK
jgi:PKHD-type hydroxylase|tara:strand:+ start:436 stop:1098 length:663 start_codon:yes stop_codon:yes gene_type:complete